MASTKYLDKEGLLYYNEKLKSIIAKKADSDTVNAKISDLDTKLTEAKTELEGNIKSTKEELDGSIKSTNEDLTNYKGTTDTSIKELEENDNKQDEAISSLNTSKANKDDVTKEITEAISGITNFSYEIVDELPETGDKGTIYLVLYSQGTEGDVYQEFIWIESTKKYETLGYTNDIDLSNYVTFDDTITNSDIDNMFTTNTDTSEE
jgi:seryl-tRNA synthetase